MKKLYAIYFVILFVAGGNILNAQDKSYSKTAGIYILDITLSEEFTEEYIAYNYNSPKRGYSISALLPDTLLNSIKKLAEDMCGEKLKAEVKCIYKISKKGEQVSTVGYGHVEGMPTNMYKGAVSSSKMDYYIKMDVLMQTGGEAIFLGKGMYSRIKPRVSAYIKVFDEEKNEVWTNKVSIKDFSTLRLDENAVEILGKSYPETLGPVDIYMIYKVTMNRLMTAD